jgi:ABC-type Fe3+-hydroxamate transport system substrate-binding protein
VKRRNLALVIGLTFLAVALPARSAESDPVRVATLCPFVVDALSNAPGRVKVVASVRSSATAAVPEGIADLGNPHTPNVEILASSKARFVVADRLVHAALAPRLEAQGFEVILVDTTSVDGTFAGLLEVGRRVGAGDGLTQAIDEARASLNAASQPRPEKVLALLGMPSSFFVMTRRSWQGDLLQKIGFQNVAGDASGDERMPGFVPLSDEILAGLAPDRVLLVAHGDPRAVQAAFERRIRERGLWLAPATGAPPAVEVLSPDRFLSNPGLALPDVAREVVSRVTPPAVSAP